MKKDVVIIGAGASGLLCAIEAAKRDRKVLIIDHANKVGKKILMSGGGRCNFTNYYIEFEKFQSHNHHFIKSALTRYTQWDFIALVEKYHVKYHEKTLGQLFCNDKSKEIVNVLLAECEKYGVEIKLKTSVEKIKKLEDENFFIKTNDFDVNAQSLVIATGGLSIPTMGATGFGYQIAKEFNLKVYPTQAALVPFVASEQEKQKYAELSGIAVDALVFNDRASFRENILFTHRGLSGPSILQISSYWKEKESVTIKLLPDVCLFQFLSELQKSEPKILLKTALERILPKRLVAIFFENNLLMQTMANLNHSQFNKIKDNLQNWQFKPQTTEGYRTAEVTSGGVDCNEISSKTFEAKKIKGLYFIGEVLDVTGWLGGYNFQWAWSSGWAAGQVV